jgi:hypothetical protein
MNLSCNNLYLNYNIWYYLLMCVDCVLASSRIVQANSGRRTPSSRWFCHRGGGGGYLGEDLNGEEQGREWPTATRFVRENEENRKSEGERKKKDLVEPVYGGRAQASLIPYRDPWTSARVASFGSYVA